MLGAIAEFERDLIRERIHAGLDLARKLRHRHETRELPIILLTARAETDDRVVGLDAGADDDTITLQNGIWENGTVDGGSGTDQLLVNSFDASGTDFENIESTTLTASGR